MDKKILLTKEPIIKNDDFLEPKLDIITEPEPDVVPIDVDKVIVVGDPGKDVEPEIFIIIGVE